MGKDVSILAAQHSATNNI